METHVPDIGPNYPSGGERIAPAWRATWMAIEHSWRRGTDIARTGAAASTVTPKTVMGLLSQAAKVGLIERKYTKATLPIGQPRRVVWYRHLHAQTVATMPLRPAVRDAGGSE